MDAGVLLLIVLLVGIEALLLLTALVEWVQRRLAQPAPYRDTSRGHLPPPRGHHIDSARRGA